MKSGGGRPDAYRNAEGDKLPSVTTVTGRFKDSGGLIYAGKKRWHEAGRKGLPWDPDAYWSDVDALEVGSVVHAWIEDEIHYRALTEYPDLPAAALEQANSGYGAYLKWRDQTEAEILYTEMPLVSEEYQYGGTLDAVAEVGGTLALLDWKSSNATYQDYIAQLAAYRQLWNENIYITHQSVIQEAYLLRVGKELGNFTVHYWPKAVLDIGFEWFKHALALYDLDKQLKKVAK